MYQPPPYRPPLTFPGAPEPPPRPSQRFTSLGCVVWSSVVVLAIILLVQISGLVIIFGYPETRDRLFAPLVRPDRTLLPSDSPATTPIPSPQPTSSPSSFWQHQNTSPQPAMIMVEYGVVYGHFSPIWTYRVGNI